MSPVSSFFNTMISPVQYTYKKTSQLLCLLYFDRVAEIAFNFFKSYGDAPKDLAKVVQVLGSWTVIVCKEKGAFNGLETAQKVSDFGKQAKCFLSCAGIWTQLIKTRTEVMPNGVGMRAQVQNDENRLKKAVNACAGLYNSIFDSVSLLGIFGIMSSQNRYFKGMEIGNCLATVLGATTRGGDNTYQLGRGIRQGNFRSESTWKNAVNLVGNAAILTLGAFPLLSRFKYCNALSKNRMLQLSTITVITTLLDKHIPASFRRNLLPV